MASAGAFTFRVLVRMKNIPAHARSVAITERILGTSCADVEIAPPAVVPIDDDRECFVAAWCIHPRLVPDEKIMAILEPVFLAEHEDLMELPALRYLVRCRVVEYQDWSVPDTRPMMTTMGMTGRTMAMTAATTATTIAATLVLMMGGVARRGG